MKRYTLVIFAGLFVLLLASWGGALLLSSDTRVDFADSDFERAVRASLGTDRPLTEQQLQEITSLTISNSQIESLEDLRWFGQLIELHAGENLITDLSPLEHTPHLQVLSINDNHITDLEPVRHLGSLRTLHAQHNQIRSLEPLADLTGLVELNVRDNRVSDLQPLGKLAYLEIVNVRDNQISDLSALATLTRLRDLNVRNNLVTSFEVLGQLEDLTARVYVQGNPYEDQQILDELYHRVRDVDFGDPSLRVLISQHSGYHDEPFEVIVEAPREGIIRYTLDGSEPTNASPALFRPLLIEETSTLRAKLFLVNGTIGETVTRTYLLNESFAGDLPILSLAMNPAHLFDEQRGIYVEGIHADPLAEPGTTGNFMMRGPNWERPVQVSYFTANEPALPLFEQGAGIRIYDGDSLDNEKKSFILYSRGEIGPHVISHPLFENSERGRVKQFILSHGQDHEPILIHNAVIHTAAQSLAIETKRYHPTTLYLNGEDWGVYQIVDHYDHHYFADHHQVDQRQLDLIKGNGTVLHGDDSPFYSLLSSATAQSLADPVAMTRIAAQMDTVSFIDYLIVHTYFQSNGADSTIWRERGGKNEWQWALSTFDRQEGDAFSLNTLLSEDTVTSRLFVSLLENEAFKSEFISRLTHSMNTVFDADRLEELTAAWRGQIEAGIPQTVEAWGYPASVAEWEESIDQFVSFLHQRPEQLQQDLLTTFDLRGRADIMVSAASSEVEQLSVNGLPTVNWSPAFQGTYLTDVPMKLELGLNETWSSTNDAVAAIDGDHITFLDEGSATLLATSPAGDELLEMTVTVTHPNS